MGNKLTITLTGRLPVTVDVDTWPKIGMAKSWEGQYESQSFRKWYLTVRQCQTEGDDRCIISGVYTSAWGGESDRRGGVIVDSLEKVPEAVQRVAEYLGFDPSLADECIATLPAEEL